MAILVRQKRSHLWGMIYILKVDINIYSDYITTAVHARYTGTSDAPVLNRN